MTLTINSQLITAQESDHLINFILKNSQAEDVFININSRESSLSRFSENQICQNLNQNRFNLTITSYFGQKSASCSTTETDPESILYTLRQSEELAQFAPADPEWVELLPSQSYDKREPAFDQETAQISPLTTATTIKQVCQMADQAGVDGSGILSTSAMSKAIANSRGLRAFNQGTEANFSLTARIDDGSSWQSRTAYAIKDLPFTEMTEKVIKKALFSRQPQEVKPDKYPVIFTPCAFGNLIPWLMGNLDARSADEGRSFMSLRDEKNQVIGNRLGELLFSPLVHIQRQPSHPLLQAETFFNDGLPNTDLDIVKNGVVENLSYSRYWAKKQSKQANGYFTPIFMSGENQTIEDLIATTERGIFVNRTWYINTVNPRTLEITGMTRDGTFWIEDGKLAYPLKNFRFNHCLPHLLRDISALGQVERFGNNVIPAIKVKEFNFSSITDSV